MVSDHAAVPPTAELHVDVSFDEMVRVRGENRGRLKVVVGGITGDPSLTMGRGGVVMVGTGGRRDRTISLPVGDIVRRVCGRMKSFCPFAAPPTYNGGWYAGGRGWCWGRRSWRGRCPRRGRSGDRRVRPGLGVGVRGGAWASRRGEKGGDTRCSRRDYYRDKRVG